MNMFHAAMAVVSGGVLHRFIQEPVSITAVERNVVGGHSLLRFLPHQVYLTWFTVVCWNPQHCMPSVLSRGFHCVLFAWLPVGFGDSEKAVVFISAVQCRYSEDRHL